MCEESWTSAVLNCSASSQCTRWNFRYPNFCCFLFIPFYSSIQHPRTHTPVMALSHGCQDLQTFSPELELLLSLKMILLLRVYKGLNWSMQGSIKKKGFCFVFFFFEKKNARVIITCRFSCCHLWSLLDVAEQRPFDPHQCLRCLVIFLFCISEVLCNLLLSFLRAGCAVTPWWCLLACFSVICWLWELAWESGGC